MILRFAWVAALLMLVAIVCGQDVRTVKEIDVSGNARISKEAILSSMSTKVGSVYTEEKLDADRQTLTDLGFFSTVDVHGAAIDNTNWKVIVQVAEYPVIKELRITGSTVISIADIRKVLPKSMQEGQLFNSKDRDLAVTAIRKLYSDRGYLADVSNIGPMVDSPATLSIEIIEEHVGFVSIQGNKFTKDWVMRRLIKTRPGEIFSAKKWQHDLRRMFNTQWFEWVHSTDDETRELGLIDLTADVKEQRNGSFNVGLQLDPESSLAGIIRYTQSNVGGTGQTMGVDFLQATSGGGPSITLNYSNPFIDDKDTVFNASIYSKVYYRFANNLFGGGSALTTNSSYDERHTGISLGFSRPFSDYEIGSMAFKAERVNTENLGNLLDNETTPNDPTDDQSTNNFIKQDGDVVTLSFGYTRNRRDVDVDPSRGDWFQVNLEPGYANIDSVGGLTTDTSILGPHYFAKATAEYRYYWSPEKPRGQNLDAPRTVIATRIRYGNTFGEIPFFEQYFAGGSDTLRGYPDDRFWGKQTLLTNLELRYPIQKTFSLIGFIDYGGAWGGYGTIENFTQDSTLHLHLGYGPGISFRTPLGNIQLFLGFNQEGGTQTHFLIGNSF